MEKEIVGMRSYDFRDQRGQDVQGYTLYLQWKDENVAGVACESISISLAKLGGYDPALGDVVRVGYNRYGKVDFVLPVA
ncbi:hypothetical protein [uncultured Intestinimonas sp.]|uniref:hypothetical protein n=1 Tax=uncultured Intestinimonas sp. TaxID=1689265 RepID=UPI0026367D14|nr:hypothetical protein [uncultured Intestinimonas sp.]